MNIISNNPYRILGLLVGATAKEQSRQINRLKKYIEAEQELPNDNYSFSTIGNIIQTIESIEEASAKLNLEGDKMNAALFWFWNGNPITDEVAFDALKDGNTEEVFKIWKKLITETKEDGKLFWRTVTEKNASAFHNYSVLEMLRVNGNKHSAIVANLYFLESEFSQKFISTITDSTYKTNSKKLQIIFLNEILQEIEHGKINFTLNTFVSILNAVTFTAKADFLKSVSQKIVAKISTQIETVQNKRIANKAYVAQAGETLYQQTKNDLEQLKSMLGVHDFTYSNIADKVANKVLQCGIDYYNDSTEKDSNNDYVGTAIKLAKQAKVIACGDVVKQRCDENIKNLQIKTELEFIVTELKYFQQKHSVHQHLQYYQAIAINKNLATSCKPKLDNIKVTLGANDNLYLTLSSAVVSNIQGSLVATVNRVQEDIKKQMNIHLFFDKSTTLNSLKSTIRDALEVINFLSSFDMDSNLRNLYNTNKNTLQGISNQINAISTSSNSGGGCYIATMAYGSYEHPQVMVLRQFRDDVLYKSMFGRWFIKCYYHYSPKLVKKLKDRQMINKFIRIALNQFIKIIK